MKRYYWLLPLLAFLAGCAGSPLRTAADAERNRMDMMNIRVNMSMDEVQCEVGIPKKIERRSMNGIEYEIWYYITQGVNLDQTRYIDENFTPFVFYGTYLRGWGWRFYNHLFDINNARFKDEESSKTRYPGESELWPNYENKIIEPLKNEPNARENSIEESIQKLIEPKEKNGEVKQDGDVLPIPSTTPEKTPEKANNSTSNSPPASGQSEPPSKSLDGIDKASTPTKVPDGSSNSLYGIDKQIKEETSSTLPPEKSNVVGPSIEPPSSSGITSRVPSSQSEKNQEVPKLNQKERAINPSKPSDASPKEIPHEGPSSPSDGTKSPSHQWW